MSDLIITDNDSITILNNSIVFNIEDNPTDLIIGSTNNDLVLNIENNNFDIENSIIEISLSESETIDLTLSPIGIKGDKGDIGSSFFKYGFSYGDASPIIIFSNFSGLIKNVELVIFQSFNGDNHLITVGDSSDYQKLFSSQFISLKESLTIENNNPTNYVIPTNIYLSITPGINATTGSGFIIIEV
jgi:hypothetical protein